MNEQACTVVCFISSIIVILLSGYVVICRYL